VQAEVAVESLALLDAIFLFLETAENPKHIGAVLVFDPAPDAEPDFVKTLVGQLRNFEVASPFNRRVRFHTLAMPTWETVARCDLDYHVRHVVLPAPANEHALLDHIARAHEPLLDRDMPLWEFHIIEGLEQGRFALYTKIHHACIDGLSGIARIQASLHGDPHERELRSPWGSLDERKKSGHKHTEGRLSRATSALRDHLQAGAELSTAALQGAIEMTGLVRGRHYLPFSAPRTALNRPVHRSRAIGVATLPVDRVQDLAHRAGTTVNDVVLSVIDDALHRYLQEHGADSNEPLIAMVPMSLREEGNTDENTQACLLYIELGSDHASPLERLAKIHRSSSKAKAEAREYSAVALADHSMLMIGLAELVGRLPMGGTARPVGNVLVSNVPGSDRSLFLHGAKLRAAYPMSTLMPGCTLNVTLLRHGNQLDFGLVASRETIPDVAGFRPGRKQGDDSRRGRPRFVYRGCIRGVFST
jgi:WS/DGAT/MGAT family acyltransferase